ncbi:MAG: MFS transporter [Solirubrobacteraceae bacterium]
MSTPTRSGTGPSPQATGQVTLRELVRDRPFLLYLIGQATSGAGSALSSIALVFAVLSISRSAGSVGLVLLASRVPGIALTLAGGVIADRWSRKRIAVGADATRTGLQLATGILLLTAHATVLDLAALQLVSGSASAIFAPAAGALLADVAPRGQVRRASSLLGITTAVMQTGGLAVSGVLVALAGPGISLLIDSATFALSTTTLALIQSAEGAPRRATSALLDLREGWRAVTRHRWLMISSIRETIINVLVLSPVFVLGPIIAKDHLGGAPAWSAIALGYVIGNLAAAHITYHWAPRRPVLAAFIVSIALVPMLALLGIAAPLWLIIPAAGLAGAETTIYNTLSTATLQANLPKETLGRATAITNIGSSALVPIGMGLAGLIAAAIGTSTVMLGGAALVLITTAICIPLPATHTHLELDRQP